MLNRGVGGSGRGVGSNSAAHPSNNNSSSNSNSNINSNSNSNINNNSEDGDFHILGFVTKKVVLTSHYDMDDDAQALKETFPLPAVDVDSFMDDADSIGKVTVHHFTSVS